MNKKLTKTAFPDQLKKVSSRDRFRKHDREGGNFEELFYGGFDGGEGAVLSVYRRIIFLILVVVVLFGLFLRLFHLQIVQGAKNRELADSNRIQVKIIHAPRGVIYDRNGKVLAQNDPGFRLLDPHASDSAHVRTITRDEALMMEVSNDPQFHNLEVDSIRSYPMGEKTAHILGYVGEITKDELSDPLYKDYRVGDKVGRGGIEEAYEKVLRGVDGGEIIEVDSAGNKVRTIREIPAIPGSNVVLSIDAALQDEMYMALKDGIAKAGSNKLGFSCCGAAIAQDPMNGQILALVSYPSFEPSHLEQALTDPNSPMLNRVIAGTYPPGSTFKIVSSLAGLASGKITPQQQFEDTGVMALGPYTFANWYYSEYGKKEGPVDLIKAITRSNDIYYYHLGQIIGEEAIANAARKLGLGQALGIDIPGEAKGVIPDGAWKERVVGEQWYPGDTLHMSIGQGYILTTPLQISNLISMMAADGKEYPPHLVDKITNPQGATLQQFSYSPTILKDYTPEQIQLVKKGLALVPQMGGTAWPFFNFSIPTAGKTGTAEFGDPKNRTHAWYTSYAPVQNPKIALTVLVEAGGEGSTVAGAISKDIYTWYFNKDKAHIHSLDQQVIATQSAKIMGE